MGGQAGASKSLLLVPVASRSSRRHGLGWHLMRCGSPASWADESVLVGLHPWVLIVGTSENGCAVPLDQRVAVVLSSSSDQQDQVHVHSVAVHRFFRETGLEAARGRESSLIPCRDSAGAVTVVAFGLQMKKGAQHGSMNTVRGVSSLRYARDSPMGSPWRDSFFSAGEY